MFDCSPVFHRNNQSEADIVINQGGTDSGKTYAIMQLLFSIAVRTPPPATDPVITIVGESIPNLKKGAYRAARNIYTTTKGYLDKYIKGWNETDRTIYFKNGWMMEFISCDTEQSAKQGKRQYLFVNEAQGIDWPIFWQLAKRTRIRTFIDYNPTAPFWAHDNLIGTDRNSNDLSADVELIISDHRHNPFLTDKDHFRTENIKDKDLWEVYARGKTGNLQGLIYPDWREIPDTDFPWDEPAFAGLDFGYTNDPTAGVRIARVGESIFLHELCYTPGIAPIQMKQILTANGLGKFNTIYCEHDPDQVAQLRRLGVNAIAARKGPGSINAGIIKMKEFSVYFTASSTNLKEERKRYMWAIDPVSGKPTNTPIDQWNHLMDAARMGVYTQYFRA